MSKIGIMWCSHCNRPFSKKRRLSTKNPCCCKKCYYHFESKIKTSKGVSCYMCKKIIIKKLSQITNHTFCGRKCYYEWCKSKKGTKNPLYQKQSKRCVICGLFFYRDEGKKVITNRKVCSRECWVSFFSGINSPTFGRHHTEEAKIKIREARKNQYFIKVSMAEKLLMVQLDWEHILFSTQKSMFVNKTSHAFDFVINDLFIEVDGCYWHYCIDTGCRTGRKNLSKPIEDYIYKKIERDKIINKYCKDNNYKLLRIWEHDIYKDPEKVVNQIKTILNTKEVINYVR